MLVQLCTELVVFLGPISYRGHLSCIDFSVQHSSRISISASFSLQPSLSPCDHFQCHLIDSLVRQRRKHSFSLEDLKVSERIFRFPTTSGWLLPETTLPFFPAPERHAPSSLTSACLNVITTALSTTFPALSRVTYTPCFCFPLFATLFLFGMTVPEPNEFRQLDTFPHLRNCTPKISPQPASCTPLALHRVAHPWLFMRRQLCIHFSLHLSYCFCRFLCLLFCACSYTVFFCVSVLAKLSTPIFPWGGILI